MKPLIITFFICTLFLQGCGIYKPVDSRKTPVNVKDRVAKNIEEGRGVRFGRGSKAGGGVFDFASSNELWRATLDVLDFVSLSNASYSGGVVITDWIDGSSLKNKSDKDIKIHVRFLSNEIRADGLEVLLYERKCASGDKNNCRIKKSKSSIENEIKLAILKKATLYRKQSNEKSAKEYRKKYGKAKHDGFNQEKKSK